MAASHDERNRILNMIETGKLSATQAGQLLDSLDLEYKPTNERGQRRTARIRVTDLATSRQKMNVTIPVSLIHVGLRLGTRLAPQLSGSSLEDLLHAIEYGATGRLLDLQDMEEGERVEIFTE